MQILETPEDPEAQQECKGLKYPKPFVNMASADDAAKYLTDDELAFFEANMDTNSPEWQVIAMAITIKQQQQA